MKVLIVGGVAGGASAAARLRRLDEHAEIIMFERGNDISFANCGIPYYCGDVIKDRNKLLVMTPEKFKALLNVESRTNSDIIRINRDKKTITVINRNTNEEYEENYDKLVISPGAAPVKPPIEGINDSRIITVRNLDDADQIKDYVTRKNAKKVSVIGAGFIGLEMAENFVHLGIETSIIELSNQVMAPVDYDMAAHLHNVLRENGVRLHLEDGVKSFSSEDNLIVNLNSGEKIEADFAIFAIGVRPENKIAKEAGLEIGSTGGILVDKNMRTSDENIYAVGDAVEIIDLVSGKPALVPLAGPANKQGRIAADNICGINSEYKGTQGTSILKLFDYAIGITGNSEKVLKRNGTEYLKVYAHGNSHADYYPGAFPLMIKLLFAPVTGKILGAQAIGIEGVDKRLDVIATALRFGRNVNDLIDLELTYAPPFGSAKDPVNIAGMAAQNVLSGKLNVIEYDEVENLKDAYLLDVRTLAERSVGAIEGSICIPLEELRSRIDEIPRDKKIVIYCSRGRKSYFAARILVQNGFENVYSFDGGYVFYKQILLDRKKKFSTVKKPLYELNSEVKNTEIVEIDACGMQCPGPIMSLAKAVNQAKEGQIVEISTTDPAFKLDIEAWCNSTNNKLINVKTENKIIKAQVQKGDIIPAEKTVNTSDGQTIVVFSNDLDKALATFVIANAAAAAGKKVTLFFTFWGINILRKSNSPKVKKNLIEKMFGFMMPKGPDKLTLSKMNMLGVGSEMMKNIMKSKNIPSVEDFVQMSLHNGIKMLACSMSMDVMGIKKEELLDGVEVAGAATYIDYASQSNNNLFI